MYSRPSWVRTVTSPPPATTWLLVRITPEASMMTPDPIPPRGAGAERPGLILGPPRSSPTKHVFEWRPAEWVLTPACRLETVAAWPSEFHCEATAGRFSMETTEGNNSSATVRNALDRWWAESMASCCWGVKLANGVFWDWSALTHAAPESRPAAANAAKPRGSPWLLVF